MINENDVSLMLLRGENIRVEFKSAVDGLSKDVFDTVCSFSNREGGTILLGVDNNGNVLGINPSYADRIKKDFVTSVNNGNKFYPPLYLSIEDLHINGKLIFAIVVPECNQVCRHRGRIWDRNHDSDIDITDNFEMVRQLYLRKGGSYFINKITGFSLDDLRHDLFERARIMTRVRSQDHPWRNMSDEDILRSSGLIMRDEAQNREGLTLAGVLLFGKDTTIMAALPHHKTDMLLRVENLDRYDDRDVIITNLIESYDRMMAFCQKHLSDPFVMEGTQSISARDKILREICSNTITPVDTCLNS